jgi:hypothetical protein
VPPQTCGIRASEALLSVPTHHGSFFSPSLLVSSQRKAQESVTHLAKAASRLDWAKVTTPLLPGLSLVLPPKSRGTSA